MCSATDEGKANLLYLIATPQNKLEQKGRVSGWRFVPIEREGKKQLREMCAALRDKGVSCAYASDLDAEALHIVADELHIPFREDFGLRRVNAGRHHAAKIGYYIGILEHVIPKWGANPDIPIRGGDSLSSIKKRLLKSVDRLLEKQEDIALVTDAMTATLIVHQKPEALLMNGQGLKPGKIYKVPGRTA